MDTTIIYVVNMLYTIQQVAEKLKVSRRTIESWRWRYFAHLPLPKSIERLCSEMLKVGRCVRIPEDAINRFLLARKKISLQNSNRILELGDELAQLFEDEGKKTEAKIIKLLCTNSMSSDIK